MNRKTPKAPWITLLVAVLAMAAVAGCGDDRPAIEAAQPTAVQPAAEVFAPAPPAKPAAGALADTEDPWLPRRLSSIPDRPWPDSWFQPREDITGAAEPFWATLQPVQSSDQQLHPGLDQALAYSDRWLGQALVVWQDGALLLADFAEGSGPHQPFNSYHMHWLPLVLAIGAAVDQGAIESLDDPVSKYLVPWQTDPRGTITIRELLTMSSGLELYKDSSDPADLATHVFFGGQREAAILAWPAAASPGTRFEYNYVVPELLGMVLERATGQRYADFLSASIWRPLGNNTAQLWLDQPDGRAYQNAALFASGNDWLSMGVMLAENGQRDGTQILSPEFIQDMVQPGSTNENFGFVWLGHPFNRERRFSDRVNYYSLASEPYRTEDVIIIDGYLHRLYVVPSLSLVVLRVGRQGHPMATKEARWDDALLLNPVLDAVLSREGQMAANPVGGRP